MTDADKARLKKQIVSLGQYKPLLVTMDKAGRGIVLGGNMRLTALRELVAEGHGQFEKVWISIVQAEDDKTKLEYALSDNDRAGTYDNKNLFDMVEGMPDFDLQGYSIDYGGATSLQDIVDRYTETEEDEFDADAEAKKIKDPVSKRGMIYQLGDHRLMCGDSTSKNDVLALLGGVQADMCFTDPPYNVDYSGKGKKTSNTILNDHMGENAFRLFLEDVFASYRLALKKSAPMYVCYASRTHREFEDALNKNEFMVKAQIIWVKTVASFGWGNYRWKHEPILYCNVKGESIPFYGDRKQYTEWIQKPNDVELLKEAKRMLEEETIDNTTVWKLSRDSNYEHPTQKPIQLIEIALKNSSKVGDTVIDLFGGSGSTLIGCEQLQRKCLSMELDPRYVDVIVKRWEKISGREAVVIHDGTLSA